MNSGKKGIKKIKKMLSYSADASKGRNWKPPKESEEIVRTLLFSGEGFFSIYFLYQNNVIALYLVYPP